MMSSMHGSGMDMGSNDPFRGTNMALARLYWYLIVGVVGCGFVFQGSRIVEVSARLVLRSN